MIRVYFVLFALFFISILGFGILRATTTEMVTDRVVKTERIEQDGVSKYMIFGEHEVYENSDSLWHGKFNSSDYYRDIQAGKVYTFKVAGWRVPVFSWYRNIVGYTEVKNHE